MGVWDEPKIGPPGRDASAALGDDRPHRPRRGAIDCSFRPSRVIAAPPGDDSASGRSCGCNMRSISRASFALGLLGLGLLTVVYRDFALQWQPAPSWVPARTPLALASGAALLLCGAGLLVDRFAAPASRVMFYYALLWVLLLKVPKVAAAPTIEVNWNGLGEICVVLACCWALFATLNDPVESSAPRFVTGPNGVRIARYLFAIGLLPVGLAHFVYLPQTTALVPAWLPFRTGWAELGGAGHIAAGLAVLFGIAPALAASLEAAMIGVFTMLVWLPGVLGNPPSRLQWTAFWVSWTVAGAAWVVAVSLAREGSPSQVEALRLLHPAPPEAPRSGATTPYDG